MTDDKTILGIDTGTNSLGWAVVVRHANGTYTLKKKGSLIFQEGVKIEKGIESSKASERTRHRALRKQYFRRRLRKIEVLKVLVKHNLCPFITDEQLQQWHTKKQYPKSEAFMAWQRTDNAIGKNTYYDRHVCLHTRLNLELENDRYILGRAMYHLAQRRGFLSNRLEEIDDDKDAGKVKESISNLTDDMHKAGFKFLGDYFYALYSQQGNKVRLRNRYTDREKHYKKEFYEICRVQQLDAKLVDELARALFFSFL